LEDDALEHALSEADLQLIKDDRLTYKTRFEVISFDGLEDLVEKLAGVDQTSVALNQVGVVKF
jgi:hypothetical protein